MLKLQIYLVPPSAQSSALAPVIDRSKQQQQPFNPTSQHLAGQPNSYALNGSSTPITSGFPSSSILATATTTANSSPYMNVLGTSINISSRIKKFLHITAATNTLQDVCSEIQERFLRLYPDEEPLNISKIQDSNECDLDPDYTVSMVFDNQNIVRVLLDSEFVKATRSGKRRLATELNNVMKKRKYDQNSSIWNRSASLPVIKKRTHPLQKSTTAPSPEDDEELQSNNLSLRIDDDSANNTVLIDPKKNRSPRSVSQIAGSPKRITSGMLKPTEQPDLSKNGETTDSTESEEDDNNVESDYADGYRSSEDAKSLPLDQKKKRASVPTKTAALNRKLSSAKKSPAGTVDSNEPPTFQNSTYLQTPSAAPSKKRVSIPLDVTANSTTYLAQATPAIIREAETISPAIPRKANIPDIATTTTATGPEFAVPKKTVTTRARKPASPAKTPAKTPSKAVATAYRAPVQTPAQTAAAAKKAPAKRAAVKKTPAKTPKSTPKATTTRKRAPKATATVALTVEPLVSPETSSAAVIALSSPPPHSSSFVASTSTTNNTVVNSPMSPSVQAPLPATSINNSTVAPPVVEPTTARKSATPRAKKSTVTQTTATATPQATIPAEKVNTSSITEPSPLPKPSTATNAPSSAVASLLGGSAVFSDSSSDSDSSDESDGPPLVTAPSSQLDLSTSVPIVNPVVASVTIANAAVSPVPIVNPSVSYISKSPEHSARSATPTINKLVSSASSSEDGSSSDESSAAFSGNLAPVKPSQTDSSLVKPSPPIKSSPGKQSQTKSLPVQVNASQETAPNPKSESETDSSSSEDSDSDSDSDSEDELEKGAPPVSNKSIPPLKQVGPANPAEISKPIAADKKPSLKPIVKKPPVSKVTKPTTKRGSDTSTTGKTVFSKTQVMSMLMMEDSKGRRQSFGQTASQPAEVTHAPPKPGKARRASIATTKPQAVSISALPTPSDRETRSTSPNGKGSRRNSNNHAARKIEISADIDSGNILRGSRLRTAGASKTIANSPFSVSNSSSDGDEADDDENSNSDDDSDSDDDDEDEDEKPTRRPRAVNAPSSDISRTKTPSPKNVRKAAPARRSVSATISSSPSTSNKLGATTTNGTSEIPKPVVSSLVSKSSTPATNPSQEGDTTLQQSTATSQIEKPKDASSNSKPMSLLPKLSDIFKYGLPAVKEGSTNGSHLLQPTQPAQPRSISAIVPKSSKRKVESSSEEEEEDDDDEEDSDSDDGSDSDSDSDNEKFLTNKRAAVIIKKKTKKKSGNRRESSLFQIMRDANNSRKR